MNSPTGHGPRYRQLPLWRDATRLAVASLCRSGGSRESACAPTGAPTGQGLPLCRSGGSCETCLNPQRIPMRIISHPLHQTGPHRVGHHITGGGAQRFFAPQGMVVKTWLPKRLPRAATTLVDHPGRVGFEMADQCRQTTLLQLHQPMQMVGHQHESQGLAAPLLVTSAQLGNRQSGKFEVGEHGGSCMGHRGDQIHLAGFGISAQAQSRRMCWHGRHYVGAIAPASAPTRQNAPVVGAAAAAKPWQPSTCCRSAIAPAGAPTRQIAPAVGAAAAANARCHLSILLN